MRHPQAAHEDTSLEDVIGQDETPRLPTKAPTRETQDLLTIPVDDVPSCIPDIDPEDTQLETVRTCSTLSHQIEESPARETTPVDDHEPSLPGDSSMEPFVSEETSEDNHSTEGDQTTGVLKPEREQPVSVHRSHFPFFEVEESIAEPSIFEDDRRSSHSDNTFGLELLFTDYSPATQPSGDRASSKLGVFVCCFSRTASCMGFPHFMFYEILWIMPIPTNTTPMRIGSHATCSTLLEALEPVGK
jgi:hypothetical protein